MTMGRIFENLAMTDFATLPLVASPPRKPTPLGFLEIYSRLCVTPLEAIAPLYFSFAILATKRRTTLSRTSISNLRAQVVRYYFWMLGALVKNIWTKGPQRWFLSEIPARKLDRCHHASVALLTFGHWRPPGPALKILAVPGGGGLLFCRGLVTARESCLGYCCCPLGRVM